MDIRPLLIVSWAITAAAVPSPAQDPDLDARRHEQLLFNGQVQVPPGKQYVITFSTRSNYRGARIAGNVQAAGGSGNDIRVLVATGQSIIYDSGRRRSVVMSVDFSRPGQYTLVFDNSFSLVSPKVVFGRISLVHWGVDVQKDLADREEAANRYQQAVSVLGRLYDALRSDERIWGTSQMLAPPQVRLINDRSINAAASWTDNTLRLNRGLFDFIERLGEKGNDVLAATLAHELSHIFYRHPGYGSGQGLKGLFDELRGVTALDRVQEREADVLGIRLSCQAGFDPEGVLVLMQKFAEQDPSAGSFMKTHPSAVARLNYLQSEVASCQALQAQARQPASASESIQTSDARKTSHATGSGPLWRLVQSPKERWRFKIEEEFLYGERVMTQEQGDLGDFDTVYVQKEEGKSIGTQRVRLTTKVPDDSAREVYRLKVCRWDFAVEITSVTANRIEGR
jgi:hypothetical protein